MKGRLVPVALLLLTVFRSPRPVGSSVNAARVKSAAAPVEPSAAVSNNGESKSNPKSADGNGTTTPCDRYLRSAEVEVRNPRNHKFVTSNGWTDRQRPRPEINVYSRIEELPSPQPPPPPPAPQTGVAAATAYYQQQQRDNFYQHSSQQLQPAVRTSKRIIYYATLPDVVRTPVGYPPPPPSSSSSGYPADPYSLGPGPFSADFRHVDSSRNYNGPLSQDHLQRNRVAPYENAYNRGGTGVTSSVTSKSTAVYNSRYDEPAEFRDSFFRPNEFTSKFASWAEPFYKSWTSSPWDRDPVTRFSDRGSSPYPWDRDPPGGSPWDSNRGASWDSGRASPWDSNRGSSWDKDLVEVPLQKPGGGGGRVRAGDDTENRYDPEVAVVQSGVIDVRGGERRQDAPPPRPPPSSPPGRFTIVDVDPKPYRPEELAPARHGQRGPDPMMHLQRPPDSEEYDPPQRVPSTRYDPPPQKPMRYEAYTPMQPPTRYEQDGPPPSAHYGHQYPPPPPPPARYGHQDQDKQQPNSGYYETVKKNNVNTHQFMTSWTEVSTKDEVSPTHTVSVDVSSLGNSTSVHSDARAVPHANSTKTSK